MNIIKYEAWLAELISRFGENPRQWTFICPSCGKSQSGQDFADAGVEDWQGKVYQNCIGRYVAGKGCDWTLGGFIRIHKSVVIHELNIIPVFEMAAPLAMS